MTSRSLLSRSTRASVAVLSITALGLLAGCAGEDIVPAAPQSLVRSDEALPNLATSRRPVGVAVDPDTHSRVLLTTDGRLYESARVGEPFVEVARAGVGSFYDITALGGGRFAIMSDNNGFLYDRADGSLVQHFCYLPGEDIREEPVPESECQTMEIADGVTLDAETGLLYAQPRTVCQDDRGTVIFSEIATFDLVTGEELRFVPLSDTSANLRGLVSLGQGRLMTASGTTLGETNAGTGQLRSIYDLRSFGLVQIEGMALDREAGVLYVVDATNRLIGLDFGSVLAQLNAAPQQDL